jgi:hypothetical protein
MALRRRHIAGIRSKNSQDMAHAPLGARVPQTTEDVEGGARRFIRFDEAPFVAKDRRQNEVDKCDFAAITDRGKAGARLPKDDLGSAPRLEEQVCLILQDSAADRRRARGGGAGEGALDEGEAAVGVVGEPLVEASVGDGKRLEVAIPFFFGVAEVVAGGSVAAKNPCDAEEQRDRRRELVEGGAAAARGRCLSEDERRFKDADGVEGHSGAERHAGDDDGERGDALVELQFLGPEEGALDVVADLAVQACVEAKDLARIAYILETIGDLRNEVGASRRGDAVWKEDAAEGGERPGAPVGEGLHEAGDARRSVFRGGDIPAVEGGERDEPLAGLGGDPVEGRSERRLMGAADGVGVGIKGKIKGIAHRSWRRSKAATPPRRALADRLAAPPLGEPAREGDDRPWEAVDGPNEGDDAAQRGRIERQAAGAGSGKGRMNAQEKCDRGGRTGDGKWRIRRRDAERFHGIDGVGCGGDSAKSGRRWERPPDGDDGRIFGGKTGQKMHRVVTAGVGRAEGPVRSTIDEDDAAARDERARQVIDRAPGREREAGGQIGEWRRKGDRGHTLPFARCRFDQSGQQIAFPDACRTDKPGNPARHNNAGKACGAFVQCRLHARCRWPRRPVAIFDSCHGRNRWSEVGTRRASRGGDVEVEPGGDLGRVAGDDFDGEDLGGRVAAEKAEAGAAVRGVEDLLATARRRAAAPDGTEERGAIETAERIPNLHGKRHSVAADSKRRCVLTAEGDVLLAVVGEQRVAEPVDGGVVHRVHQELVGDLPGPLGGAARGAEAFGMDGDVGDEIALPGRPRHVLHDGAAPGDRVGERGELEGGIATIGRHDRFPCKLQQFPRARHRRERRPADDADDRTVRLDDGEQRFDVVLGPGEDF